MSEKATEKLKIGGTNSDYGILEEYSTAIFSEISCVARSFGFTYEESRANAELIVKCVNGYEALEAENAKLKQENKSLEYKCTTWEPLINQQSELLKIHTDEADRLYERNAELVLQKQEALTRVADFMAENKILREALDSIVNKCTHFNMRISEQDLLSAQSALKGESL